MLSADELQFIRLSEACCVLSDEVLKRRRYDHMLAEGQVLYDWSRDWTAVDAFLGIPRAAHLEGRREKQRSNVWSLQEAKIQFHLVSMAVPSSELDPDWTVSVRTFMKMLFAISVAMIPFMLRCSARSMIASIFRPQLQRDVFSSQVDAIEAQAVAPMQRQQARPFPSGVKAAPSFETDDAVLMRIKWALDMKLSDVLQIIRDRIRQPRSPDVTACFGLLSSVLHSVQVNTNQELGMEDMCEILCFILSALMFRDSLHQHAVNVITMACDCPPLDLAGTMLSVDNLFDYLTPLNETTIVDFPQGMLPAMERVINSLIDTMEYHKASSSTGSAPRACTGLFAELSDLSGIALQTLLSKVEDKYLQHMEAILLMVNLSPDQQRDLVTSSITLCDVLRSPAAKADFVLHITEESLLPEMKYFDFCVSRKDVYSILASGSWNQCSTSERLRLQEFLFEFGEYFLNVDSEFYLQCTEAVIGKDIISRMICKNTCNDMCLNDSAQFGGHYLLELYSVESFILLNSAVSRCIEDSFNRYRCGRVRRLKCRDDNQDSVSNSFSIFKQLIVNEAFKGK